MENLLKRQPVVMTRYVIHEKEDVAINGECSLPDYCPDIAVVLKCMITPYVQNRQWSGQKLLVDGTVHIRVLYLDEERRCPREVEFSIPLSCVLHRHNGTDATPVALTLTPKYIHCRAIGPRRLEARGVIEVLAQAEEAFSTDFPLLAADQGVYAQVREAAVSHPIGMVEKIITINETVDFPEALPPAEILLGGECRAVIQECKVLSGKAIVKGQVYVHQLYAVGATEGDCRCLDSILPFSQIVDVEGLEDGMPCRAIVQILADTQRCMSGPDGDNTALDIMVKLFIQLQAYRYENVSVLTDVYHTAYPVTPMSEEVSLCAQGGMRWEKSMLPMKIALSNSGLTHICDVWIEQKENETVCHNGVLAINGRWFVCVLARDVDGQVVYSEYPEEYCLEFVVDGNKGAAEITVTELHYRVVEDQLELHVGVCVALTQWQEESCSVIRDLQVHTEQPYPSGDANLMLYYAQSGEKVWDIASCCHTSPDSICAANALECDSIPHPSVLLVPIER